ncbi:MAG: hypothetical protein J2P57_14705 [Acidimicrobiaceae bacterium]|nr:hypothetical protein [Acidimicrobiaceae bacterium]
MQNSEYLESALWADLSEIPAALESTLNQAQGFDTVAEFLSESSVRRIIAVGNGAAYYVAHNLWLASLDGSTAQLSSLDGSGAQTPSVPEVIALPAGLLKTFHWRRGDVLLALSSSGEFRDLVEATRNTTRPYVAITANPRSPIATSARATATYQVLNQRAVTHTQAFCSGVATALAVWSKITGDRPLSQAVEQSAEAFAVGLQVSTEWLNDTIDRIARRPGFATVFGSGCGWSAALEAALLLKEVALIPAEGAEAREGGTTSMYPLAPGHLAVSLPHGGDDTQVAEAEAVCAASGATLVRLPAPGGAADQRLATISTFPAASLLSLALAKRAGLDPDRPKWEARYYMTARSGSPAGGDAITTTTRPQEGAKSA